MQSSLPKAVRELTREFSRLPGIGPKTAQRLAIHLLRQPSVATSRLAQSIQTLHEHVQTCSTCFNLSEQATCSICSDESRDPSIICVVKDPLDIEAIERTDSYTGLYHVLGGVLSPMEGIGTDQLTIHELFVRTQQQSVKEIIIALEHDIEGEATARHIASGFQSSDVSITRLARGLPTGGDIEFADAMTLNAAFEGRKGL